MYYTHLSITACIQLSCVARHQTRSWSKPSFSLVDCRSQQWTGIWSKAVLTMKVKIRYGVRMYHSYPAAEVYHFHLVFSQIHFHLHQSILHDKVAHSWSKPSFSWVGRFSCPSQPNRGKPAPATEYTGGRSFHGALVYIYNIHFWHIGPWTLPALESRAIISNVCSFSITIDCNSCPVCDIIVLHVQQIVILSHDCFVPINTATTFSSEYTYTYFMYSAVPDQVSGVSFIPSANENTLSVEWNRPQSDTPILHYEIQYRRRGHSWQGPIRATAEMVTIRTSLVSSASYGVQVRAVSAIGAGPYSREVILGGFCHHLHMCTCISYAHKHTIIHAQTMNDCTSFTLGHVVCVYLGLFSTWMCFCWNATYV